MSDPAPKLFLAFVAGMLSLAFTGAYLQRRAPIPPPHVCSVTVVDEGPFCRRSDYETGFMQFGDEMFCLDYASVYERPTRDAGFEIEVGVDILRIRHKFTAAPTDEELLACVKLDPSDEEEE